MLWFFLNAVHLAKKGRICFNFPHPLHKKSKSEFPKPNLRALAEGFCITTALLMVKYHLSLSTLTPLVFIIFHKEDFHN